MPTKPPLILTWAAELGTALNSVLLQHPLNPFEAIQAPRNQFFDSLFLSGQLLAAQNELLLRPRTNRHRGIQPKCVSFGQRMEYGSYSEITMGHRMIYLCFKKNENIGLVLKFPYVFSFPTKGHTAVIPCFSWRCYLALKQKDNNKPVDNQAVVAVCTVISGTARTFTHLLPVLVVPESCTWVKIFP